MATIDVIQPQQQTHHKKSGEDNPRKAATKVKEANYNLDMMRRRLLVLQGQEDYNRHKTLDQEKRINRHQDLHERMVKDRQLLRKSLDKTSDLLEAKEKAEQIRNQIRYRLTEARRSMMESRTDRTNQISKQSTENQAKIHEYTSNFSQENKMKKHTILEQEQQIRNSIIVRLKEKVKRIKQDKTSDAESINKKAIKQQAQMDNLALFQQELLKKNSESLMASQIMRKRYNDIFTPSQSGTSSRLLPSIRSGTNNSKFTENQDNI